MIAKRLLKSKAYYEASIVFFATTQAVIIGMIFGAGLGAAVGSLKTQAFNSFGSSTLEKWPADSCFLAFPIPSNWLVAFIIMGTSALLGRFVVAVKYR